MSESQRSNIATRVLVAVVTIPLIIYLSYLGGYFFFGLICVISSVALWEFYVLVEKKGVEPIKWLGMIFGFLVTLSFLFDRLRCGVVSLFVEAQMDIRFPSQFAVLLSVIVVFVFLTLVIELFRKRTSAVLNISATLAGVLYISLFLGMLIGARELFSFGFPFYKYFSSAEGTRSFIGLSGPDSLAERWGGYTIISVLATIWICDTAAYFGGRAVGRHKLFERVSPKKTWEGALFGFVSAILAMVAAKYLVLEYMTLADCIVLSLIVGVFGQLGDLVESLIKRDAGVKDSSAIIPGHGGMFDRFDSLVFVSPLVYLYLDLVVL